MLIIIGTMVRYQLCTLAFLCNNNLVGAGTYDTFLREESVHMVLEELNLVVFSSI